MINKYSIIVKIRNFFSTIKYEPEEYWKKRGKNLNKEKLYESKQFRIQENELVKELSKLQFTSVLEVGCGYGRITKLLIENFPKIKEYTAIDFSQDNINFAKGGISSNKISFKKSPILEFNPNKKYDLIISVYVLMHVKPAQIDNTIKKLVSLSNENLVNVDWYDKKKPKIHFKHNFIHDYISSYNKNDVSEIRKIEIPIQAPKTSIFTVKITS